MSKRLLVAAAVLAAFAALSTTTLAPGRRFVRPALPGGDGPPFSGAVRVGETLYLSGTLGLDENRRPPEDPEAEARKVLDNVRAVLDEAGMTMDDLVSVQVFCSDVAHYDTWNRVYRGYFKKEFPARAFIGSGRLLYDARFEVQAIAAKR